MSTRSIGLHSRIYRGLLWLYPVSFRREYGRSMAQTFSDRLGDKGGTRTWLLVLRDLAVSVPIEVMEASLMSQKWMGGIAIGASVLFVIALVMGIGSPLPLTVGAVLVVAMLVFAFTKRDDRPTEYLYGGAAPKLWTWWTVLAASLAVVYVVTAAGQLINDPKATNVGAFALMSGVAALIAVGLRLRSHSKISGNWMIIFAATPALLFFWMIWPAVIGLAIIVGDVREIVGATPRAPQPV